MTRLAPIRRRGVRHDRTVAHDSTASVTPATPSPEARWLVPTYPAVLHCAWVVGVHAALVNAVLFIAAWILRVDFTVTSAGSVLKVNLLMVIGATLLAAVAGGAVGGLLLGRRNGGRLFLALGTVVAVLSLAGPLVQPDTTSWPTRIVLLAMHVITWFVVVPQLARFIGDADPV